MGITPRQVANGRVDRWVERVGEPVTVLCSRTSVSEHDIPAPSPGSWLKSPCAHSPSIRSERTVPGDMNLQSLLTCQENRNYVALMQAM
jgi:hypothetical protein